MSVQKLTTQVSNIIELNKQLQATYSQFEQRFLILESEYEKQIRDINNQLERRTVEEELRTLKYAQTKTLKLKRRQKDEQMQNYPESHLTICASRQTTHQNVEQKSEDTAKSLRERSVIVHGVPESEAESGKE